MKCIKKGNKIIRVSNEVAKEKVEKEGYKYCPKSDWIRDQMKAEEK